MQFFKDEQPAYTLEFLEQLLNQPFIDIEQAKTCISAYCQGYKDGEQRGVKQVLGIIKLKLHQIGLHLPAQYNNHVTPDAKDEPKKALNKISDLIFHCVHMFGKNDSATYLLNQTKALLEVNAKIVVTTELRKAFFEDLSKLRESDPSSTPPGLRDIYKDMDKENKEAIQVARMLYS